jgi:hypothetical protein
MNRLRACKHCNTTIPVERLEVFPDTFECVNCSTAKKPRGLMTSAMSKGCGAELMILPNDPETLRQFTRYRRHGR